MLVELIGSNIHHSANSVICKAAAVRLLWFVRCEASDTLPRLLLLGCRLLPYWAELELDVKLELVPEVLSLALPEEGLILVKSSVGTYTIFFYLALGHLEIAKNRSASSRTPHLI